MGNFSLTQEAQEIALKTMADEGFLDIRIERTSKNTFDIGLFNGDVKILEMAEANIPVGGYFTLTGFQVKLDLRMK